MATHSSILAQRISWTEEPGGLLSMGLQSRTRLKHLSMHACIGERNGSPLQCSCLENPRDRGAWWAAVYGVAESDTTETTQQQQQDISDKVDVNPHSIKQRQKFFHVRSIYKDKGSNLINQTHSDNKKYTFLSSVHGIFINTDHKERIIKITF